MKNYKTLVILYYLAAALFYVAAIVTFTGGNESSMGPCG